MEAGVEHARAAARPQVLWEHKPGAIFSIPDHARGEQLDNLCAAGLHAETIVPAGKPVRASACEQERKKEREKKKKRKKGKKKKKKKKDKEKDKEKEKKRKMKRK